MSNKQASILYVEDEDLVREMITMMLEEAGYKVTAADSVAQALSFAEKENFDLCFSDVNLLDNTGLYLCIKLKQKQYGIKILFCSGALRADQEAEIDRLGYEYLSKPFEIKELLDKIDQLLN